MTEIDNSFIQHLTEMKARERYSTIQEMMDYIIAETRIREILWSLRSQEIQFTQDFSFLEFDTQAEVPIYDFLVTKDNFDLMIFLNDKKENGDFLISKQRLEAHRNAFKHYPSVEGIADVWINEIKYPTKYFFLRDIELKLSNGNEFIVPPEEIRSFDVAVTEFFNILVKKTPTIQIELQERKHFDVLNSFEKNLRETFTELKSKQPRIDFRSKALDELKEDHMNALIELFQEYCKEKLSPEELQAKIWKIARI
ncbi:MAG: hypothetical protein HXS54_16455 [Theionarchaea archaeon]|nr:hypothetical protein [Theionarchaea archaeon]